MIISLVGSSVLLLHAEKKRAEAIANGSINFFIVSSLIMIDVFLVLWYDLQFTIYV